MAEKENFAELLEESIGGDILRDVVKGTVLALDGDAVHDVGMKSEGRVPLEFGSRMRLLKLAMRWTFISNAMKTAMA